MEKTNDISIVDNKRVGILKVKYDGDTFAIFNYCREGDEKEQCYPTRERAIEMAKMVAQSLANIINLQISLGKLTSDGIKVEKTNDKER